MRPAFLQAVIARIEWLAENRPEEQLDNFLAGLTGIRDRIAQNPEGAPIVKQDEHHVLRMHLFPRPLPYLVYYGHAKGGPIREVYLVRLYGSGQYRPEFSMAEWPW